MVHNFFRASEVREHRLCFEFPQSPPELPDTSSASETTGALASTEKTNALPNPETMSVEEVSTHMATMIVQTHAEMLTAWEEGLVVLDSNYQAAAKQGRLAKVKANKYARRGNDHSPGAEDTKNSALWREEQRKWEAEAQQYKSQLDAWVRQKPTLQQAEYVLTGINPNPGQQNQAEQVNRGNATPSEAMEQRLGKAAEEFYNSLSEPQRLVFTKIAEKIEKTFIPENTETLRLYFDLINSPSGYEAALNNLNPDQKGRIATLIHSLDLSDEEKVLFDDFLKKFLKDFPPPTLDFGASREAYSLSKERDNARKEDIIAILERMEKEQHPLSEKRREQFEGTLMMRGVDTETVNFGGQHNDPDKVTMYALGSLEGFCMYWAGLVKWVQSFGMKNEPKKADVPATAEITPEEMSVIDLEALIAEKQKILNKDLPEEKKQLEEVVKVNEKELATLKADPNAGTEPMKADIQKKEEEITEGKRKIAEIDQKTKDLKKEISSLQVILEEKKKEESVSGVDAKIENTLHEIIDANFLEEFTVENGVVRVEGGRLLSIMPAATKLPAGIRAIEGSLSISGNSGITSLPDSLKRISGSFFAYDSSGLTTLPADLQIGKDLNLRNCTNLLSLPSGLNVGNTVYIEQLSESTPLDVGTNIEIKNGLSVVVTEATATEFWAFMEQCAKKDIPKGRLWVHSSIELEKKKFEEENTAFSNSKIKWPPEEAIETERDMPEQRALRSQARETSAATGMKIVVRDSATDQKEKVGNQLRAIQMAFSQLNIEEKALLKESTTIVTEIDDEYTIDVQDVNDPKVYLSKYKENNFLSMLESFAQVIQEEKAREAKKPNAEPEPVVPEQGNPPAEPVPEAPAEVTAESVLEALKEPMRRLGVVKFAVDPDQAKDVHDNLADIKKALAAIKDGALKGIDIFFSAATTTAVTDNSIKIGYNEEPGVMQKNIESVLKERGEAKDAPVKNDDPEKEPKTPDLKKAEDMTSKELLDISFEDLKEDQLNELLW